jgi:hypothetical protein
MLRLLALALLLANGVYFAWGQGLLLGYGFGPTQQSEPQRISQQIAPEAVVLLSAGELARIQEQIRADQAPKECLQAGPLDEDQSLALRQTLRDALPADAWEMETLHIAPRWMVYLGKYTSADSLAKKRSEIAAMGLKTESFDNPSLEPGLSLGGFDTKADADAALVRLTARGLHTARVVQERLEATAYQLKLPAVGPALVGKLGDVRTALGGKPLHKCN